MTIHPSIRRRPIRCLVAALFLAAGLAPGPGAAQTTRLNEHGCHWSGTPRRYHCRSGEFQSRSFEKKREMREERADRDHPRMQGDPALVGFETRVVRVADGDTIHVRINGQIEKVRYIGVNAPEVTHPDWSDADMWRASRLVNSQLVLGKRVTLEFDGLQRDAHGRLLAYVWVDGVMANAEMVRRGYAQAYKGPNLKHYDLLLRLEDEAREDRRGLWGRLDQEALDARRRDRERQKERAAESGHRMRAGRPEGDGPQAGPAVPDAPGSERPSADP